MSTLDERRRAAVRYLEAGEKKPCQSDRQNMRPSPEDAPHYWNDGQNIGLLTGEPSGDVWMWIWTPTKRS